MKKYKFGFIGGRFSDPIDLEHAPEIGSRLIFGGRLGEVARIRP